MRLLLAEDDNVMIGESITEALIGENYALDWVRDWRTTELAFVKNRS